MSLTNITAVSSLPLRMRAIPEHLRGVITTRRYTNPAAFTVGYKYLLTILLCLAYGTWFGAFVTV